MSNELEILIHGDESAYVRALKKAQEQEKKVEEGMKKIGEQTKRNENWTKTYVDTVAKIKPPPPPPPIQVPKPPPVPPPVQVLKHAAALKEVKVAGDNAFGPGMVAMLGKYTSAAGAAAGAISLIKAAIDKKAQDTSASLGTMRSLVDERRDLAQVSNSPGDLKKLAMRADDLAVKYGVDRNTAQSALNDARTFGFESDIDKMARGHYLYNLRSQADVASKFPTLFKGSGVTGLQAVNMVGAAANRSALKFDPLARAMPAAAASASQTGSTPEETLGMLAVFGSQFKSADVASDRIAAFASRVAISSRHDKRFRGKTLYQSLDMVRNEFSPAERDAFLGKDKEVGEAYSKMIEFRPEVESMIAHITEARRTSGTAESPLEVGTRVAMSDPILRSERMRASAEASRDVAYQGNFGVPGAGVEAAKDRVRARMAGKNPFARLASEMGMWFGDAFSDDPAVVAGAGIGAAYSPAGAGPNDDFRAAAADLRGAAQELRNAAPSAAAQRSEVGRQREN